MKLLMAGAALALALPLGGCLMVSADVRGDWDGDDDLPRLFGAEVSANDTVTIISPSNGCTDKGDFRVDVKTYAPRHTRVSFRRVEEDHCKALALDGARLTWTFEELGVDRDSGVTIANRVGRSR